MDDYCAFSKKHKCPMWMDYILTRQELEETSTLCHGNWIEIERLRNWTDALTDILDSHGISYPSEWDFDNHTSEE